MKKLHLTITTFVFALTLAAQTTTDKKVVIAYVFGTWKLIQPTDVDASLITHINYAFVNIRDGKAHLEKPENDTLNFRTLNQLKRTHPQLKILISIGGWTWSKHFSDISLTSDSRKLFAKSAVDIVNQYQLDGIDIDWEYPGLPGDNNIHRPEDKQNFTLLLEALRNELNQLTQKKKRDYLLTIATGGSTAFLTHTEMYKAEKYLDYVNIMCYDYFTSGKTTGHHTNLYYSQGSSKISSSHLSVQEHIAAGVPPHKIVMGVAFYGRAWKTDGSRPDGLYSAIVAPARGGGFTKIKDSLVNQNGFTRYWDDQAKAPYLYNSTEKIFITYDDEASMAAKCQYVKEQGLAGVMFWEYYSDPKNYLLRTINSSLGK